MGCLVGFGFGFGFEVLEAFVVDGGDEAGDDGGHDAAEEALHFALHGPGDFGAVAVGAVDHFTLGGLGVVAAGGGDGHVVGEAGFGIAFGEGEAAGALVAGPGLGGADADGFGAERDLDAGVSFFERRPLVPLFEVADVGVDGFGFGVDRDGGLDRVVLVEHEGGADEEGYEED